MKKATKRKNNVIPMRQTKKTWIIDRDIPLPKNTGGGAVLSYR